MWKAHKYGEGRLSDAAIQIALAESPSSSSAIQPSLSTIEFTAPALETIILCACFKEPLLGEMIILQHAKYRAHRRTISTSDKQVEALVPPRQTVVTLMANELGSGNTMVSWLRRRYSVELMDRGVGASKWSTAKGIRVVAALGGREWCVNLGRNGLLMRAFGASQTRILGWLLDAGVAREALESFLHSNLVIVILTIFSYWQMGYAVFWVARFLFDYFTSK